MYVKLALRNVKRSAKDYLIYFATITLCVGILFSFLSVAFSPDIADLAENMSNFQSALIVLSVFLMSMFSFLISYAMNFIVKRRKKEFTGVATLSFGAIYISLILFLVIGTLLSLQQSSEDTEIKYRFSLLRKLGTNESDVLLLMRKQISFYFALPAILPAMFLIFIGIIMKQSFGHLIAKENIFLFYTGVSFIIFGVVYATYLILSYTVFKMSMVNGSVAGGDLSDVR